jgi:hypothetical protein
LNKQQKQQKKMKFTTSVFHYKQKEERCFEGWLLAEIAICILTGDRFNPDLVLPTYFWYNNEYASYRHRNAPIKQVISQKDINAISQFITSSHAISFDDFWHLREHIKQFFSLKEGNMFSLDRLTKNYSYYSYNSKPTKNQSNQSN